MKGLEHTAHRPWSLPKGPWIMTQTWHHLLFAHWPVPPARLEGRIPEGLTLDRFEGQAWVGVVPFQMSGIKLRGILPIPTATQFPEINLRTYVVRDGKPGVYFFSLDADSWLAVVTARRLFHLPYFHAGISVARKGDWIEYHSQRTGPARPTAVFQGRYRPLGNPQRPAPNTLAHWLTERYCLYTINDRQTVLRGEIHHEPWPLQSAEVEILENTVPKVHGIDLPDQAPLLHFAERLDVLIWPLVRM
jgi:uncharacterized protein YqjF (DUF2071 family)